MHTAQSMHSSGSMARKFGPSRKQSTGQTSTQSVYLQRMHDSRTTWVMAKTLGLWAWGAGHAPMPAILGRDVCPDGGAAFGRGCHGAQRRGTGAGRHHG